jgi:hypothetical protein
MTTSVHFDVARPETYDSRQIWYRLALMIVMAVIGAPLGWLFGVLFVALPLLAATAVATVGAQRYLTEVAPLVTRPLTWVLELYAYLGLLVDRIPDGTQVRYQVTPSGTPTVGSALMHLVTSIPAMIFLWLLGTVSAILWVFAAASVFIGQTYPASIFEFQRGILRLFATFLAHHASLVEGASPLRFETGPDEAAGTTGPMPPTAAV